MKKIILLSLSIMTITTCRPISACTSLETFHINKAITNKEGTSFEIINTTSKPDEPSTHEAQLVKIPPDTDVCGGFLTTIFAAYQKGANICLKRENGKIVEVSIESEPNSFLQRIELPLKTIERRNGATIQLHQEPLDLKEK